MAAVINDPAAVTPGCFSQDRNSSKEKPLLTRTRPSGPSALRHANSSQERQRQEETRHGHRSLQSPTAASPQQQHQPGSRGGTIRHTGKAKLIPGHARGQKHGCKVCKPSQPWVNREGDLASLAPLLQLPPLGWRPGCSRSIPNAL